MDNPSNLDGFDGLPLDLWINQFQSHQENPSSVFHHPTSQPLRDYSLLTSRTIPVAFPMEDALAQVSQSSQHMNSSILSQYGLSLPSQPEHHQLSSHERSAWSHMMSLDQSMGSYGSHDPGRLVQNRYSPLDDLVEKTREDSLIKSHAISSFPSINLSRASFTSSGVGSSAPESHNNYYQHPSFNSSQEKGAQHLGQLMNLSKTSSNMEKAPHGLTVVTDMSTLESSGEYSPVSPPTITAAEKLSMSRLNVNPGRPAELLLRENEDVASSYAPSLSSTDPTDIFSYFSKMESCPTDLSSHSTQDSKLHTHSMHSSAPYHELPSPSDTPLDMTTAISTKTDTHQTVLPKLITTPVTFDPIAQPLCTTLAGNEKLPLLQTLLNKGKIISNDSVSAETVSDRGAKQLELSITSNIKLVKPLKSTPKKSNFYGRDASLFSFPAQEPLNDSSQSFITEIPSKVVDSKSDDVKEDGSVGKNNLDKCENSFPDAWEHTSHEDASTMDLTSVDNQSDSSIFPLNSSDSSFTSGFSSSLAQSIDSFIEESTRKIVESDNIPPERDEKSSHLSSEEVKDNEPEMANDSLDMSCENVDEQQQVNNTEEEFSLAIPVQIKAKPGKGKKRKATGFPAKPRKQPGRKRGRAKNSKAALIPEVEPISTEDALIEEMGQPLVSPVPKKKRAAPKARAELQEVTPRRSSSRKSKDNAMRLIELQADSNYGAFRPSDEEQPTEKKSLRSSKKTPSNKVATEISDDLSEQDSVENKSDDDYEIDEEEAQVAEKDEIVEDESNKIIKSKERKLGGLKISIKLSGNSSAEIVSGIADSPVKKKRKVVKKKNNKAKNKRKILSEELPEEVAKDTEDINQEVKEMQSEEKAAGSLDASEKHKFLMEKYFSSANSATVARQTQKSSAQIKGTKIKKKVGAAGVKLKASKGSKTIDEEPGGKQKSSVKFDLDTDGKTEKGLDKEDFDSNTPKFVCGYCPQRYHSKQDLMAHMEDHMMEMEGKDSAGLDEKKRPNENLGSAAVSRDPRANRTPTIGDTQPANKQIVSEKKPKLVVELDKDFDVKNELAKTKFRCGECGEMFTSKPGLLDHVRIHTADKPFECDICHKCFTEIKLLSAHRKTHVPEKLVRCHMCSKAFVDKADLNQHMQSHPKRSGMNLPGKLELVHKKTLKKSPQEDKGLALPPKKPTSFASALSGETEPSDKDSTAPLILLLKRGAEMSSTPVLKSTVSSNSIPGKSTSSEAKLTSKPPAQAAAPPKVKVSVPEIKTKQPETRGKDVEKPAAIKSENNKTASSDAPTNKTEQNGVCNCKECPDCVTRFLQSFE